MREKGEREEGREEGKEGGREEGRKGGREEGRKGKREEGRKRKERYVSTLASPIIFTLHPHITNHL